jgi:RNA 2',3'-cyclic 3'-phosphodiesterase
VRLFAGIELHARVRQAAAEIQHRLLRAGLEAKYEPAEKLHVTLAFLGNVKPHDVDGVEGVLVGVASETRGFSVTFDKIGAFPNERRPHIVWLGSRASDPTFRALSNRLRSGYRALGFTFENDAIPHVTLARIKGGGRHPVPLLDIDAIEVRVDEIALFESIQAETTTRYVIRRTARLLDDNDVIAG